MSNFILNFGPQHPAAHGVLRLILELDGERIVNLDPHIGFLHRGTEKLIESKTYIQSIPYFDRLDYVSMLTQEHVFVLAAETLLNLKISRYSTIVRTMFDEISRILNHIMCITTHALDIGALTPFLWGFEEREYLMSFYEFISGARMHAAYYRIGGVASYLPQKVFGVIYDFLLRFNSYINIIDDLLSNNNLWLSRLKNVGIINKKLALNNSMSGPIIRGVGLPWDLRKIQPYAFYRSINFKIPVGVYGDCYSRYYIRLLEMKQSVYIINKCLSFLSKFENVVNKDVNILSKSFSKYSMEQLIFEFKEKALGLHVKKGDVYSSIEVPKGEMGVHIFSKGGSKPYRCRIKSPGFFHLQSMKNFSQNLYIADLVANIGSVDIVFGEIDR